MSIRPRALQSDAGGRDRGLKLFVLGFHLGFVFVDPDPINSFGGRFTQVHIVSVRLTVFCVHSFDLAKETQS